VIEVPKTVFYNYNKQSYQLASPVKMIKGTAILGGAFFHAVKDALSVFCFSHPWRQ